MATLSQDPQRIADALWCEKAVIATLIEDPDQFPLIIGKVNPENFYEPRHKSLFFAVLAQHNEDLPIDYVSIYERVEKRIPFDVLVDISDYAMPGSIEHWIERLNAAATRRRAQELLQGAMNDFGHSDTDLIARVQNMSDDVIKLIVPRSHRIGNMSDGMIEELKAIEAERTGAQKKIRTGIQSLDMVIGGLRPGNVVVLAGRTSMGKTALAQNMILAIAQQSFATGWVSIEGIDSELRRRFLSIESSVPITSITSGELADYEYEPLIKASAKLSELQIGYVDGETNWTKIKANIQLMKFEEPELAVVFIDHMGLIQNPGYKNRWEAIGAVSADMKILAQNLGITVVVLVQISRDTEKRKDHRPTMADLRDAGSIEQDADIIFLLYRPHYYDVKADPTMFEIAVVKQRNGPTGKISLGFKSECVRFFDR